MTKRPRARAVSKSERIAQHVLLLQQESAKLYAEARAAYPHYHTPILQRKAAEVSRQARALTGAEPKEYKQAPSSGEKDTDTTVTTATTEVATQERVWMGAVPTTCQLCNCPVKVAFIDGATAIGPWATMCISCHKQYGRGLGSGKGQRYQLRSADQKWVKVKG